MNSIAKRSMMRISLLLIVILMATLLGASPASAAAETITILNERFLVDIEVVPCAGAEEIIRLSGYVHSLLRVTSDGAGGFHVIGHHNYSNVSGISSTGVKYQAVGIRRTNVNGKVGMQFNIIDKFTVIGQGPDNNSVFYETFHFTVNANGTITASHDDFRMECK